MGAFSLLLGALLYLEITVLLPRACATQYFSVPWSNRHYGPDGPWQAVTVTVGGNDTGQLLLNQNHVPVDLLPGGYWQANILAPVGCKNYTDGTCGKGGMWDPQTPSDTAFLPQWRDAAYRIEAVDQSQILQATTIASRTFFNTSLCSIINVTVTGNDGRVRGPQLGTFPLGAEEQLQSWGSVTDRNAPRLYGFSFAGALFNQSYTASYSYALHIGAANFGYGGSLTFGGYDKGRIIGPYTTFDEVGALPTLLDIGIGVEIGGSPFSFKNISKLLVTNSGKPDSLTIRPDPLVPSLYLPGNTCQEIAKHIPVKFDDKLKYWLWDTSDPKYQTIITSPAYLSFIFPPAPGALENVTIKVPFGLLNLTLDQPIVSKPVAYFPCQEYVPEESDTYRLGRAFLQSAFLGRNWNRRINWMAQAPGPGDAKTGLGILLKDIADTDNDLEGLFTDPKLFQQSWSNHWTPLTEEVQASGTPKPTSPASTSTATQASSAKKTLGKGALAGIGVGAVVVALLAVGAIAFLLRSRRRKREMMAAQEQQSQSPVREKTPVAVEAETGYHVPYADNDAPGYYEMEHPPAELGSHFFIPHELPASPVITNVPISERPLPSTPVRDSGSNMKNVI
jgi:hypothetical protein